MIYAFIVNTKEGVGISDALRENPSGVNIGTLVAFKDSEAYQCARDHIESSNGIAVTAGAIEDTDGGFWLAIPSEHHDRVSKMWKKQEYRNLMEFINNKDWTNVDWCCLRLRNLLDHLLKKHEGIRKAVEI